MEVDDLSSNHIQSHQITSNHIWSVFAQIRYLSTLCSDSWNGWCVAFDRGKESLRIDGLLLLKLTLLTPQNSLRFSCDQKWPWDGLDKHQRCVVSTAKKLKIPYSDKNLGTSLTSYYFLYGDISAKHGLPKERTTRSDKREQYWHSREQAEGLQCNWSPSSGTAIHYMSKPVHQNRKAHIARQNTFILDTDTHRDW